MGRRPRAADAAARATAGAAGSPDLGAPVSTRALDRLAYAHDASHFLLTPLAVATPTSTEQVAALLAHQDAARQPVTFRSGGTSLSGQAVTDGLLVDTRRHFRGVTVHDGGRSITCRPGTTVRQANRALARHGTRLGPDPASEIACTIGGVVANNSSGMSCGTVDNAYATIESVVVVLADGTTLDTSRPDADDELRHRRPDLHDGLLRLRRRVLDNPASAAEVARQFARKNTMGYGLNSLTDHARPVDMLTHLLVGSEGTLGFVAEARFRTVAVKPEVATGLLVLPDLEAAAAALPDLVAVGPDAIELMDATALRVARTMTGAPGSLRRLDVAAHVALLVEVAAGTPDELAAAVQDLTGLTRAMDLPEPLQMTRDAASRRALWQVRKGLYTAVAEARPPGTNALLEDVAVPVPRLHDTCVALAALFVTHRYDHAVVFGHAKDGNLHFMLTERFDDPASLRRYEEFTEDLVDLVLGQGGTLKAEHGTGRAMAPFVERQYGHELTAVMRAVKDLFDPNHILNPGVLLTDDPTAYLRDLKTSPPVEAEVDRCVECGYCEPVCPSRNLTLTPRQRIVLRREIAGAADRGDTDLVAELTRDYAYAGLDTCAVDGMCVTACPVDINTGDLVRRLRADRHSGVGERVGQMTARHWNACTTTGSVALTVAGALPEAVPVALSGAARRVLGDRRVPQYDAGLPAGGRRRSRSLTGAPRTRPAQPGDDTEGPVIYVPSCLGAVFGPAQPGVHAAFTALAHRAGVELISPPDVDRLCCGTPWTSKGLAAGHDRMRTTVRAALDALPTGESATVVVDSSSCAHGLHDLLTGTGRVVVDVVDYTATHLLPRLLVTQRLDRLVLHPTCSTVRAGTGSLEAIAAAIAHVVTTPVNWACCGFAGDRGLLHPELTASATAEEAAEVNEAAYCAYASDNRTCEIAMTRATGRPYRHIVELLEAATG